MTTNTLEQSAVLAFIQDNPTLNLMVSARAGSGKTTTIVEAAQAIAGEFLAVAFNKKIATELGERLPERAVCKTMNAIGHGAWYGKIGARITLDADKMFRLVKKEFDREDSLPDPDGNLFTAALQLTRWAKSQGLVPAGVSTYPEGLIPDHADNWQDAAFDKSLDWTPELLPVLRKLLHASIKEAHSGVIDFDDQIYMSVLFGGRFRQFDTVIVDESQDLSPLQHLMLKRIVRVRLIMVGDPYQAIYGFRGADSNSMTNLAELFGASKTALGCTEPMQVLPLTYSFRCPHAVAQRQLDHVPDFKSHEVCLPGSVEVWPKPKIKDTSESRQILTDLKELGSKGVVGMSYDLQVDHSSTWSLADIPERGAILCRNNAPLMKLAFTLIAARRPVTILGRDLGASLASLLTKIVGKQNLNTSVQSSAILVAKWAEKEIEKLGNKESKKEAIRDREECLSVLLESSGGETAGDCVTFIKDLFSDRVEKLTLASGHRSKGLEWNWVMHLDPWRVPSRFAEAQARHGNDAPLQQELNLKYVIETRTKDVLVLANLQDCEELQGGRGVQQAGGLR